MEKITLHTGDEDEVENTCLVTSRGHSSDRIVTRNNASRHLFSGHRRVDTIVTTGLR